MVLAVGVRGPTALPLFRRTLLMTASAAVRGPATELSARDHAAEDEAHDQHREDDVAAFLGRGLLGRENECTGECAHRG